MQYVKECLQLLYWIYFKPYTLKRHVQSICPEITNPYFDNYYRRSAEARANPRLKRYDDQCWWLSALVPILYEVLCNAPVMLWLIDMGGTTVLLRFWWGSSLFFIGWLLGQLIVRAIRSKLGEKSAWLVLIAALALYAYSMFLTIYSMVAGIAFGIVAGVAGGAVVGMALGEAASGAYNQSVGIAGGVALGVAAGVAGGAMVGVALGVAVVVTAGVSVSMAVGVMVGLSYLLGLMRIPFWLPELLWTLFLKFAPVHPANRLRFLPPQFDQLIILPLPFLPGLIAEAYQENQAAARQCINYLITSTNQQKTAGKAMLLIAADSFSRCQTAHDIAAVREQLDWLPTELAGKITACLEISQDVASSLAASSPYRQEERLKQVCEKIVRLRNGLAAASAREATTLGSVLDHWLRLLETACRTLHEAAKRSEEIPQVYLAGPALDPNRAGSLFKGRRDLFCQIESLTLSAQRPTLALYGGRRSGKSSALNYLPKQMPSDILPLFVDCQGIAASSTLSGFAQLFAEQLIASARVQQLDLPAPDKDSLSRDPYAALLGWLNAVEREASSKTFLVCLDEFERIEEIVAATGSRAPLNFLRHIIQHRHRWTLLLAGAHTPEELAPYWSDYLINTRTLRISFLDRYDTLELICTPVKDFPDIWSPAAAEAVWQLTQGQPYLTQLLCQEVVEHLNRKKAKTAQVSDVEEILPAIFTTSGWPYFDEFWRALTAEQRELLLALAKTEHITPELAAAAPLLVRKEVLAQENSGLAFRVPLIERWIARNHNDE